MRWLMKNLQLVVVVEFSEKTDSKLFLAVIGDLLKNFVR